MLMTAVPAAAMKPHALSLVSDNSDDTGPNQSNDRRNGEAERIGATLARLVREGNVRSMEALASVIVRSDWGQISAAAALPEPVTNLERTGYPAENEAMLLAGRRIARRALAGTLPDHSHGANRFHRVGDLPDWARESHPVAEIGEFLFYRS